MFRCVRLWTGSNHQSCFEEGWIDLPKVSAMTCSVMSSKRPASPFAKQAKAAALAGMTLLTVNSS